MIPSWGSSNACRDLFVAFFIKEAGLPEHAPASVQDDDVGVIRQPVAGHAPPGALVLIDDQEARRSVRATPFDRAQGEGAKQKGNARKDRNRINRESPRRREILLQPFAPGPSVGSGLLREPDHEDVRCSGQASRGSTNADPASVSTAMAGIESAQAAAGRDRMRLSPMDAIQTVDLLRCCMAKNMDRAKAPQ